MLPAASASTTLRRTVPLLKWTALDGILVRKLNSASDPTAMIGGTRSPKISRGSSRTPPPRPVNPIRVPTIRPIRILSVISSIVDLSQGYAPAESAGSGLTPMNPCCSRCRMISCAASSALRSAVLITTSASEGASYGSETPVNSLTIPARALA
jgi:hypothetical protein